MFWILYKFDVSMIGQITELLICIHKRIKSISFAVSIKFCNESGLAIVTSQKCFWFWKFVFQIVDVAWLTDKMSQLHN